MILSTLSIQKYSILQFLGSAGFVLILYVIYLQNEQIKLLNNKIDKLSDNTAELLQRLAEKEKDLNTLLNKLPTEVDTILAAQYNETIKLYVLIAGGVVLCVAGAYIFTNLFQVFSLKKIIPASMYGFIQDYTPFCQTKQTLTYSDKLNKLEVMADIINNKQININVKDVYSGDFVSLSDYIAKLQTNSGTIVPYTNNIQPLVSSVSDACNSQAVAEAVEYFTPFF